MTVEVSRAQVLSYRWHAQQLDRKVGVATGPTDCAVLDLGIQNTGPDGAAWALYLRGAPADTGNDLALAWTLRGAPHCYRRTDLAAVATATAPFSDADAAKRIFDANRPLKAAGIPTLEALRAVATEMRDIVRNPTVKGEMSSALTARMDVPYLRFCRPCNATHMYEMPFRLAALQAGLELRPQTSPPVLQRIPGWRPAPYAHTGADADARFDVIRGYLRFFGPSEPKAVAAYVDAPVKDVRQHWPTDATAVTVDGAARWILDTDLDMLLDPPMDESVRLLGPFDPYLQLKDRELLVADEVQRKALWPTLGRPGAIAVGGEIVGLWRPRTSGKKLSVEVTPWATLSRATQTGIDEQAEALADFRGTALGAVAGAS
ncbi:winged helix DNA-binding domain-containing protein [Rhodococcus sp. SGAir0479]|uniref:winged helix DNA-binding domain-containing protein n=1 Tax=Rhodococcus sp. SGAir0479 TaxID=2567884 RepID=UPI0010CD5516|nr:winged helix DNA-binding domain-containing protein [Rhodococcus sp. SGAir0479]QCQ90245.1 winged helix DNA-binding domain-containing protein [Rhodococcus sp. SGAir0479]